jgi:succinate-acetate transporter protein
MGLLCAVYLLCALRTNIIFVAIFATLVPAFGCLTGYFWKAAQGIVANNLLVAAGALTFVTSLLGWYLLVVQLLHSVDFPLTLPVGDLSHLVKGASEGTKKTQ